MKCVLFLCVAAAAVLQVYGQLDHVYADSYEVAAPEDQHQIVKRGLEGVLLSVGHGGGGGGHGGWKKKKQWKPKKKAQIAIPIKKVIKVRKVKKGWKDDWEDEWEEPEYVKFAIPKIHIPLKLLKKQDHGWH